jgi:IS5 family transposase
VSSPGPALDKDKAADAAIDQAEKLKAGIWAKVEHPFRLIKRQFGYVKVRYQGLKKNTAQPITGCAVHAANGPQRADESWVMCAPKT